ncbi:MAG: FHA domain-containing protein [Bacteroidales bacterium]|nr:FHA domain-containing protein [Bacteroidales bacterium]
MKVLSVGRGSSNDIVINDPTVSRVHCQLVMHDDGRITLADFGSSNGTTVNGQRITGEVPLNHGDRVMLGNNPLNWESYITPSTSVRNATEKPKKNMGWTIAATVVGLIVMGFGIYKIVDSKKTLNKLDKDKQSESSSSRNNDRSSSSSNKKSSEISIYDTLSRDGFVNLLSNKSLDCGIVAINSGYNSHETAACREELRTICRHASRRFGEEEARKIANEAGLPVY